MGDHITMRDNFFEGPKGYERTVYNLFINPLSKTDNTKNRNFSTLDMLPTTLGAIGVEIKNDRLALGTNLFSDKKTLMEEMGVKKFKHEIAKKSKYYKEEILKKYN